MEVLQALLCINALHSNILTNILFFILILQRRKIRLREAKETAEVYIAKKWLFCWDHRCLINIERPDKGIQSSPCSDECEGLLLQKICIISPLNFPNKTHVLYLVFIAEIPTCFVPIVICHIIRDTHKI